MRAVVQRVSEAWVTVDGQEVGRIGRGVLIFLGIKGNDTKALADHLARKIRKLRIFPDAEGRMNLSLEDISAEMLIVSQFTLYGDTKKGNRPSYAEAAKPELARELYEYFVDICRKEGIYIATGVFQAHMNVHSINNGPVTLLCYSES